MTATTTTTARRLALRGVTVAGAVIGGGLLLSAPAHAADARIEKLPSNIVVGVTVPASTKPLNVVFDIEDLPSTAKTGWYRVMPAVVVRVTVTGSSFRVNSANVSVDGMDVDAFVRMSVANTKFSLGAAHLR